MEDKLLCMWSDRFENLFTPTGLGGRLMRQLKEKKLSFFFSLSLTHTYTHSLLQSFSVFLSLPVSPVPLSLSLAPFLSLSLSLCLSVSLSPALASFLLLSTSFAFWIFDCISVSFLCLLASFPSPSLPPLSPTPPPLSFQSKVQFGWPCGTKKYFVPMEHTVYAACWWRCMHVNNRWNWQGKTLQISWVGNFYWY